MRPLSFRAERLCSPQDIPLEGGKELDKAESTPVSCLRYGHEALVILEKTRDVSENREATKAVSGRKDDPLRGFCIYKQERKRRSGERMDKQETSYTCMDYRQEMILMGLKRRLEQPDLSEDEKQALRERVRELESALDMA